MIVAIHLAATWECALAHYQRSVEEIVAGIFVEHETQHGARR